MLKPLHFRLELKTHDITTIAGRMEASKPDSGEYDRAVLDLDGDGVPEETIPLDKGSRGSWKRFSDVQLGFFLKGMKCGVEFYGTQVKWYSGKVYLDWTLSHEGLFVFFLSGEAYLYPTAEAAAKGKAIRMGPPFTYEVNRSTRGPDALLNVGLKDANGATLRLASTTDETGTRDTFIQVKIMKDGKECSSLQAEYG